MTRSDPTPTGKNQSCTATREGNTRRGHRSSLRSQVVLTLAAIFAIFLVMGEVVRHYVIAPAFADLEHAAAIRDTNRVIAAVKLQPEHLKDLAEQSSERFDPSELISAADADDRQATEMTAHHIEGVHWAAVLGSQGDWHWLHKADGDSTAPDGRLIQSITDHVQADIANSTQGLSRSDQQIFAYAAAPLRLEANEDRYAVVVAKAIDETTIEQMRRLTQVDFSIDVYQQPKFDQQLRVSVADNDLLKVETPLVGTNREIMANLTIGLPRGVVHKADQTTRITRYLFICGVTVALFLLLLQLQRLVIGPLGVIREHTERVAEQGLDATPLQIENNDEIGALAHGFERMRHRLSDTQKQLTKASHAAGRSQVADTVIHNVGNVLTNVNSLIETALDRVDGLRINPLEKLATRLRSDDNPALQAATPDYLQKLAGTLQEDRGDLAKLLATLGDNISHIHGVICDQQRHTTKKLSLKQCSLHAMLSEAIGCCRARLEQDKIAVSLDADDGVNIETDRSLLQQVLINIIGNAGHAIRKAETKQPKIDISLSRKGQNVVIEFRDNGCGMTSEVCDRVFDAHFTTRKTGNGLGLHFCAITMKRLGGSIEASSDGLRKGSTFTLHLPISNRLNHTGGTEPKTARLQETMV